MDSFIFHFIIFTNTLRKQLINNYYILTICINYYTRTIKKRPGSAHVATGPVLMQTRVHVTCSYLFLNTIAIIITILTRNISTYRPRKRLQLFFFCDRSAVRSFGFADNDGNTEDETRHTRLTLGPSPGRLLNSTVFVPAAAVASRTYILYIL